MLSENHRLKFLDILRALAALCVVLEHSLPPLFPSFNIFRLYYFQLGQFGVSLFFICSGFVIAGSLERTKNLKIFWRKRFFRLYPLYWLSLAFALIFSFFGLIHFSEKFSSHLVSSILVNMSMLQTLFGVDHALPPYWSLVYELVFYVIMSFLFLLKWNKKVLLWTWCLLILSVLHPLVSKLFQNKNIHLGHIFNFAIMFYGTTIYFYMHGAIKKEKFWILTGGILITLFLQAYIGLSGRFTLDHFGTKNFLPMTMAWSLSIVVFLVVFNYRRIVFQLHYISWLGLVSYSIYLVHPLILAILEKFLPYFVESKYLLLALELLIIIGISSLSYIGIEKPFIRIGHRRHSPK